MNRSFFAKAILLGIGMQRQLAEDIKDWVDHLVEKGDRAVDELFSEVTKKSSVATKGEIQELEMKIDSLGRRFKEKESADTLTGDT